MDIVLPLQFDPAASPGSVSYTHLDQSACAFKMDKPLFQEVLRMVLRQPVDASDAVKKTWTEGLGAVGLQAFIPDRL